MLIGKSSVTDYDFELAHGLSVQDGRGRDVMKKHPLQNTKSIVGIDQAARIVRAQIDIFPPLYPARIRVTLHEDALSDSEVALNR